MPSSCGQIFQNEPYKQITAEQFRFCEANEVKKYENCDPEILTFRNTEQFRFCKTNEVKEV
ncbi:hypothetical protein PN4B1_33520 [Paenibacillus naphthalenovorans]|nr:hypothetical protein PN4B1_33520 [Paenibacillus naphthalenovorans]